MFSLFCKFNY